MIDGSLHLTYRDLGERVHRLAGALARLGLKRGDRVALLDWNSHRYLEAYYACAHGGFAFMPVNSRLALAELRYVLKDSDARALLLLRAVPADVRGAQGPARIRHRACLAQVPRRGTRLRVDPRIRAADARAAATELDEIMQIYYTSGTTGEPKGVCLTNRNMYAGGLDGVLALSATREDSWQHSGPLFHLATSFAVWSMPIVGGAQITVHFDPKRAIDSIFQHKVTMTSLPGAILGIIADHPEVKKLASLKTIIYGGAPTPLGVLRKAAAALPPALSHAYGITETAGYVTNLKPADHIFEGSSRGARTHRLRGTGDAAYRCARRRRRWESTPPAGEVGEVACGGPKIMAGYWRKPEASAAVLRNGWYHTGDMGVLDERGYLTLVDRKKDMIITGGENVYSIEVESVLSLHPGGGRGGGHRRAGRALGRSGHRDRRAAPGARRRTSDELIEFCRGKIANYKVPKSVVFRAEPLPKTGPGKIAKRVLRDPFWKGTGRKI